MKKLFLLIITVLWAACAAEPNPEQQGAAMLGEARQLYASGQYATARDTILSLRKRFPMALEARKTAILLMDSVEIQLAEGDTLKQEFYRRKLEQEKTSKLVRIKELEATAGKSRTLTFILRDAKKSIRQLEKSIKECEDKILELIEADKALNKSYQHLDSVKGLGIVNITALIVYTNNFKAFKTSRKMATYWGVAAFRSKSGTSVDKRADVRNLSSSMLKSYLTQAAMHTIAKGGIYHDYYHRKIAEGKTHSIALNNAKNKLLHLAMSLVTHDMDHEANHEFLRTQRVAN